MRPTNGAIRAMRRRARTASVRSTPCRPPIEPPSTRDRRAAEPPRSTGASRRSTPATTCSPPTPSSTSPAVLAVPAPGAGRLRRPAPGDRRGQPAERRVLRVVPDRDRVRDWSTRRPHGGDARSPAGCAVRGPRRPDHRGRRLLQRRLGRRRCGPATPPRPRCCGRWETAAMTAVDDPTMTAADVTGRGPRAGAAIADRAARDRGGPPPARRPARRRSRPPAASGCCCRRATAASAPTCSTRCASSRRWPRPTRRPAGP